MGIVQHTVNGRAIYEAIHIEADISYVRGQWFGALDKNGKPTAACALGLAAVNLGVRGDQSRNVDANLFAQLRKLKVAVDNKWHVDSQTEQYNDVANNIIYWNDANHYEEVPGEFEAYGDPKIVLVYDLPTLDDVRTMVYELLEPYFNTEFVVDVWEFDQPNFG